MTLPDPLHRRYDALYEEVEKLAQERDALRAVLRQHITMTDADGGDEIPKVSREGVSRTCCPCTQCRTYRAAKWVLNQD